MEEAIVPNIQFFSNLENDEMSSWVLFPAVVDGQEIPCVITHQALEENCGARYQGDHLFSARAHRPRIHQLAHQLIIEGRFEEGRIVIRSRDMAEFLLS